MADPYAIDAQFYDLVHEGRLGEDVGLWLSFAGRTDRPVLEVGTGSGRIAIDLALAGHQVTGLDASAAMLALARRRAEEAGVALRFIEQTVADASLEPDHFGFVLLPADVFLYCEDGEEQLTTLRVLANAMTFNGVLAIDVPGPAQWLDPAENGRQLLTWSGLDGEGRQLDAWQVYEDDLASQTRWLRVTYERTDGEGNVRRWQSEHRLRYVYRFELEYLLSLAGLMLSDVYGDYELGPLTNQSERMIAIARRTRG